MNLIDGRGRGTAAALLHRGRLAGAFLMVTAALLLSACGSRSLSSGASQASRGSFLASDGLGRPETSQYEGGPLSAAAAETAAASESSNPEGQAGAGNSIDSAAEQDSPSDDADSSGERPYSRKLIITRNFEVETMDFDGLLTAIASGASSLGGYIENSSIESGGTSSPFLSSENAEELYYGEREYSSIRERGRTAYYVVRIPAEKLDSFTEAVKSACNVVSESMSTNDITLQYVDTDSRRAALEKEQERLLEMMEQAESVDEMIQVENALTDVRTELQQIKSKLKVYDNQVAYSTVNISITETAEYTEQTKGLSFGERIAKGFQAGSRKFVRSFQNLAIAAASNCLMAIYWIVILLLILVLLRILVAVIRFIFRRRDRGGNRPDGVPAEQRKKREKHLKKCHLFFKGGKKAGKNPDTEADLKEKEEQVRPAAPEETESGKMGEKGDNDL